MSSIPSTEVFVTIAQKDIGGTTKQQEDLLVQHFGKVATSGVLVREKHSSGEAHIHMYLKSGMMRPDNIKRMIWRLLYPEETIDKTTEIWKRRITVKRVTDRYNTFAYINKGLGGNPSYRDDPEGGFVSWGIDWADIAQNIADAETSWKLKKSLSSQKQVAYTSVPALMNTFYKESILRIDPHHEENPKEIFIKLMKSGEYLVFQHIPKLRGIIAQYRLLYMNDECHMNEYIENMLNFN